MATAIMVRQALIRSNPVIWLISLMLLSCSGRHEDREIYSADIPLETHGGLTWHNEALFTGILVGHYPDSDQISEVKSYYKGKPDGGWATYYPNGQCASIRYFSGGKKQGDYLAWWPDGQIKYAFHFLDGEYDGICREWNATGQLVREMQYVDGQEDGPQHAWYDDGKVRANYLVIDNRRYGLLGTKNCVNVSDSVFTN